MPRLDPSERSILDRLSERSARRLAWLAATLAAAALPFVGIGLSELETSSGDVLPWMPEGTPEREVYDRFAERFQTHDTLVVSWEGAVAGSDRIMRVEDRLREADRSGAEATGRPELLGKITSFDSLADSFGEPLRSDPAFREKLAAEVEGYLLGTGGGAEAAAVLVIGSTAEGAERREETFRLVDETLRAELPEGAVPRYAGPCFLAVCASEETAKLLRLVTPLTALISLLVAWALLRSFPLALLAFSVSAVSALLVIAAIHFSGHKLGDMLSVVPSLAQLLAMSNVVHLIHYYGDSYLTKAAGPERAWRDALRLGWRPTVAASTTTMIGFAALLSSNLPVARSFALFGIAGIGIAMAMVLVLTPALLILLRPAAKPASRPQAAAVKGLHLLASRRTRAATLALLGLLGFSAAGLGRLAPDVRMESFFPERSAFREHDRWFQERIGTMQGSDVMVSFDAATPRGAQFDAIADLAARLRSLDGGGAVFSPSLFALGLPGEAGLERMREAGLAPHGLAWEAVEEAGWGRAGKDRDHWRLAIHHPVEPDPRDSAFREGALALLEDWADAHRSEGGDGGDGGDGESDAGPLEPEAHLTGGYQLFSNAQDGLIQQLLRTFLMAFLVITPVVMWFLRSVRLGLVAIVGNVFPLVVFFGLLGWIGIRVDIATMMIAAVAFGIAVDNTVHFLTWVERGMRREGRLGPAVRHAFRHCAPAVLQTTLIIGLGMMAFLLSEFRPSVRFATCTAVVLVFAAVGDLVLLPALILGAFSRLFRGGMRKGEALEPDDPDDPDDPADSADP